MLPLMVVKSPKCDEMVTLPAGLTPDTRVRCPFSKEEFLIQEILDNLPPMLEVLDQPAASGPATDAAMVGVAGIAGVAGDGEREEVATEGDAAADPMFDFLGAGGATTAVADKEPAAAGGNALFEPAETSEGTAAGGAFDFAAADAEEAAGGDASAATPARRKTRPRPQKKPKNAVVEVIKVALGGVAGLLIAQMILWWLPGSWARDPAHLAPKLPGFLSWAAPERMRNPDGVQQPLGNGGDSSSTENGQVDEQPIVDQNDPEILDTPFAAPGTGDLAADTTGDVIDPNAGVAEVNGGDAGNDGFDPIGDFAIDEPLIEPPPAEELIGVRSAPVYAGEELGETLKSASEAKGNIDAAGGLDVTNRGKEAVAFYKIFCKLSERATFVDAEGQQVESRLAAIEGELLDLGAKKKNLDAIGRLAEVWIGLEDRAGDGIMLAGTVKSIAPQGKLYDTEVQLFSGDEQVITVMSKVDPGSRIAEGDRVIILGMIVEEPSLNLAGYEGNLPLVVWGGYPVALPKANAGRPRGQRTGGGGNGGGGQD